MIRCYTLENKKSYYLVKDLALFSRVPLFTLSLSYHMPICELGKSVKSPLEDIMQVHQCTRSPELKHY